MSTPTVTCPICKRPGRALTKAGVIRKHQRWGKNFSGRMEPDCPGSGQPPRTPRGAI